MISSSSISFGCIASARAIATRCCWPPESRSGYSCAFSSSPIRAQQLHRLALRADARDAAHLARRERHVLEHRHVREQVVRLEDDPDLAPERVHVDLAVRDLLAVDDDAAAVDGLEQVHAAQQRRLAGAGGADQAHDLVLLHGQVDVLQHLRCAEPLDDVVELDEVPVRGVIRRLRRARAARAGRRGWSVKRASGIVIRTKNTARDEVAGVVEVCCSRSSSPARRPRSRRSRR